MYTINYHEREEQPVDMAGAEKMTVRWLVGKNTGAKTYAMRMFRVAPGGIIPRHTHDEEHQIFILEGEAKILGATEDSIAKKDDTVFIPSNEPHGFDNREGKTDFRFICVIPLLDQ